METILVTGGCGFIGSNLVRLLLKNNEYNLVNIDKLTYAGNPSSLNDIETSNHYQFEQVDIFDGPAVHSVFERYKPNGVIHLAAESHVDRSLDGPADFHPNECCRDVQPASSKPGALEAITQQ